MGFIEVFFFLFEALEAKIKAVFTCCVVATVTYYVYEDDHNLFTNDWAFMSLVKQWSGSVDPSKYNCGKRVASHLLTCKRVSMELTVSHKTAKNLAVRRKN